MDIRFIISKAGVDLLPEADRDEVKRLVEVERGKPYSIEYKVIRLRNAVERMGYTMSVGAAKKLLDDEEGD